MSLAFVEDYFCRCLGDFLYVSRALVCYLGSVSVMARGETASSSAACGTSCANQCTDSTTSTTSRPEVTYYPSTPPTFDGELPATATQSDEDLLDSAASCRVQSSTSSDDRCQGKSSYKEWLRNKNSRLRSSVTCHHCHKNQVQTLFLPCRHLVACESCSDQMDDCIQCRQKILGTVRTYLLQ